MDHQSELYLLGEVARELRTPPHKIVYLLTSGKVPEPTLRLGNRRVFTSQDIRTIAASLNPTNKENE